MGSWRVNGGSAHLRHQCPYRFDFFGLMPGKFQIGAGIRQNMTTIEAKVPDYSARLTAEVAEREKVSVDQIVALALSAQVESWRIRDDMVKGVRP